MKKLDSWLFDPKHPLRTALFCLVVGLGNIFEAARIDDRQGLMFIFSLLCGALGMVGFVAYLAIAISERFSRDAQ